MTGTLDFTIGTSFECVWNGQEITGIVRVEGRAQADLHYQKATRYDPEDLEVENVDFLDMSLVEFEDLNIEVEDKDALYEYLRENNIIDEDIEEEIVTGYGVNDWDFEDPRDLRVDEEYDRMKDRYCSE